MQPVRPRDNLPNILFTPQYLHRQIAQLGQPVIQLRRVLVIIMANLMLEKTGLTNGAGNLLDKILKRTGLKPVLVMNC